MNRACPGITTCMVLFVVLAPDSASAMWDLARRDHSGESFELAALATASIVMAHTAAP